MRLLFASSLLLVLTINAFPQVHSAPVSSSTSSHKISATNPKPLRLEDIPSEGLDVSFKTSYIARNNRKQLGEMRDPSFMTTTYREKLPHESDRVYQQRKNSQDVKKKILEKAKSEIVKKYASSKEQDIAWQEYLRQRLEEAKEGKASMIIRKQMIQEGILDSSAYRHVKVEQRGVDLYRLTPVKRRLKYEVIRRRQDRYRKRIQDIDFKPMSKYGSRSSYKKINEKDDNKAIQDSLSAHTLIVDDKDPILGFKVPRRSRTIRQLYEGTAS
jgi:hypothetical protein